MGDRERARKKLPEIVKYCELGICRDVEDDE